MVYKSDQLPTWKIQDCDLLCASRSRIRFQTADITCIRTANVSVGAASIRVSWGTDHCIVYRSTWSVPAHGIQHGHECGAGEHINVKTTLASASTECTTAVTDWVTSVV